MASFVLRREKASGKSHQGIRNKLDEVFSRHNDHGR